MELKHTIPPRRLHVTVKLCGVHGAVSAKFHMARTDNKTMVYFPVGVGITCVICLFTVAVPVKGRNMMRCSNCMRSIYVPPISVRCLLLYMYI